MVCYADALLSLILVCCAIIAWPLTKKGAVLANNSENKGRLFLRFAKVTRKSCLDILLFESDGGKKICFRFGCALFQTHVCNTPHSVL